MRLRRQPAIGASGFIASLVIGAIAFAGRAAGGSPPSDAAAVRAEGTRLFRAKKFAAACSKFEQAAQLAPGDPEPLADLALCKQRLGDAGAAEDINRKVIDLGSSGKALTDPRFARSRRHAYFNLHHLKSPDDRYFPTVAKDTCGELRPEVGCSKGFFYCTDSWTGGGSFTTYDVTRISIAASAEAAKFDEDEVDSYAHDRADPDFGELTQPFAPTPVVVESDDSLTYLESYGMEAAEWKCDEEVWSCERSEAVAAEAKRCPGTPTGAPSSAEACRKRACDRAEHRPWPAVVKERKAVAKDQRQCRASAQEVDRDYGCKVAYANACTGLVSLICSGSRRRKDKPRTRVEEYLFEAPARPGSK